MQQVEWFDAPNGVRAQLVWREHTSDRNNILSAFCQDEYGVFVGQAGTKALDVGAHIGSATAALVAAGYTQVVAVEPLPENVEMLRKNIEMNGWEDRVNVVEGALSAEKEERVAYLPPGDVHEFIGHPGGHSSSHREISVPGYSFDTLLRMAGGEVDLVKMDCEGGEWCIQPGQWQERVGRFVAELHGDGTYDMTKEMLTRLGGFKVKETYQDGGLAHVDYVRSAG